MSVANVAAVDAAVIAVLAADAELAALVPDGVWRDVAPAGSTRAVTVQHQTHEDEEGFRMPMYEAVRYRIVAHVLETSGATADAAAARMHVLLQDQVLEAIAGYTHMATLRVERIRTTDPDLVDNDLRWQLAGGDYEITVSPDTGEPPGVAYADLVVADGASHYWRLGESAGTITVDAIGTAHGTISGGVTLNQAGALTDGDTAMAFNGTTGKVQAAGPMTLPITSTVEMWVKIPTLAGDYTLVSTRGLGTGDLVVFYLTNGIPVYYSNGGGGAAIRVDTGQWRHVVFVFTTTTGIVYVDGAQSGAPTAFTRTVASVGGVSLAWDADNPLWFPGSLDEVAIYPHALTPAQIAAHYAAATTARRTSRTFRHRKD